jgi:hypothetical protein
MADLFFQVDGSMDHILDTMTQVQKVAQEKGCFLEEGHLSENGKKFRVVGVEEKLKLVQKELRKKGFQAGNLIS